MSNLQQRKELHRTIWSMADELRGAIGWWEFWEVHPKRQGFRWHSKIYYVFSLGRFLRRHDAFSTVKTGRGVGSSGFRAPQRGVMRTTVA